jgi:hypothetical protein
MIVFKRFFTDNTPDIFKIYDKNLSLEKLDNIKEYATLAHFINPKEKKWSKNRLNVLKETYTLLFSNIEKCLLYYKNKKLGLPTEQEDFCDPYFLYIVCLNKGMKTNKDTNIQDMENYIYYSELSKEQLISLAIPSLCTKSREWLCGMISLPQEEKTRDFKNLSHVKRIKTIPLNNEEAIILGACNYSINLCYEENPLRSYLLFKDEGDYLSLEERYEPSLPTWVYNRKYMDNFFIREGFDTKDKSSIDLYLLENSFFFIRPLDAKKLENKQSPFYNYNLDECSCPLGYGTPQGKWQFLDKTELIDFFTIGLELNNPFIPKEKLNPRVIRKLQIMDSDIKNIIDLINIGQEKREKGIKSFTSQDKKESAEQLTLLLHVGFYMRGWNGDDTNLPLANTEVKDQNIVDENVNNSLSLFNNRVSSYIKDLPLLIYDKGYQFSNCKNKGLTIKDRINIVINDKSNVNACIRITSNWFVSTAYYYLSLIGFKPTFDIKDMRIIA